MEKRDIKFKIDSIQDNGEFTGYGNVFEVIDNGKDIVKKGAFTKTLNENKKIPLLNNHDPNQVLGVVHLEVDNYGLKASPGKFNLDVSRAKEIYSLIKQGAINGLSIGYKIIKDSYETVKNETLHILNEIKLYELSIVPFPMNEYSRITEVKSENEIYSYIKKHKNDINFIKKIKSLILEPAEKVTSESELNSTQILDLFYQKLTEKLGGK